jgi:hypothetical protein
VKYRRTPQEKKEKKGQTLCIGVLISLMCLGPKVKVAVVPHISNCLVIAALRCGPKR